MVDRDRIARLYTRLAAMRAPAREEDPELWALTAEEREALAAFAEQKAAHLQELEEMGARAEESLRWATDADHVDVLDRGVELLHELTEAMATRSPVESLALLDLVAVDDRRDLVCAVFAALLDRVLEEPAEPPAALLELEQRWTERLRADIREAEADHEQGDTEEGHL